MVPNRKWEIFVIKIFSSLSTTTKIKTSQSIYLTPLCVKGEDGSAASPRGAVPDPRGLLSAAMSAKAIA